MRTVAARLLGDAELAEVERVLDSDPFAAAQVTERIEDAGRSWFRQPDRVLGYGLGPALTSLCWVGVNVVPVRADSAAVDAFADVLVAEPRACSSIVGSAGAVLGLWRRLRSIWPGHREIRSCQPLLVADAPARVPADLQVRLVSPAEIDLLYPASVAMYTEEVGVSPLVAGGAQAYRARVRELVWQGRTYAKVVDGRIVFKAELGIVTKRTAQVQGVWTAPEWRGRGVATAGMAQVVNDALSRVAPTVSLYVNDYNGAARRVYEKCGFRRVGTFATVLY